MSDTHAKAAMPTGGQIFGLTFGSLSGLGLGLMVLFSFGFATAAVTWEGHRAFFAMLSTAFIVVTLAVYAFLNRDKGDHGHHDNHGAKPKPADKPAEKAEKKADAPQDGH